MVFTIIGTDSFVTRTIRSTAYTRHGNQLKSGNGLIGYSLSAVKFILKRTGTLTESAYARVYDVNGNLKGTIGSMNPALIAQTASIYTISGGSAVTLALNDRIVLEFNGGDEANYISVYGTDNGSTNITAVNYRSSDGWTVDNTIIVYMSLDVSPSQTTVPAAPFIQSRAASGGDPNNDIEVFFFPVDNATQYNLEISSPTYPLFNSVGDSTMTPINGYIVFPVQLNQGLGTYQYRVRAKNSSGYSSYSNITGVAKTTSSSTIPTTPVMSLDGTYLEWTTVSGATAYNLERVGSTGSYVTIREDLQVSYDTSSQPDGTHYYRVRAKNSAGYSNYSNVVTIAGSTPPPIISVPNPPIIQSSTYSITDGGIVEVLISWTPISGATSYNPEVQSPTQSNYTSFGDSNFNDVGNGKIGFSSPIDSGNGNYLFRVRARNSAGYSAYSNVTIVTRDVITPTGNQTQQVFQISTPNNVNTIRGTFNTVSASKWIYDNTNSQLCNYPEFAGLNVPCSLSYYIIPDILVSEPDNFASVIDQIRQRYLGNNNPPTSNPDNKNLLNFLPRIFVGLTGLGMLVSKK